MATSDVKLVGYIGLGLAGGPLAECVIKKGFTTLVRDADPKRVKDFLEANQGLNVSEAPAGPEGFKDVDVLITMVPNGHIVREILLGKDGIAPHMKAGNESPRSQ